MKKNIYSILFLLAIAVGMNAQTSENVLKLLAKKNVITAKEADSLISVEKKAPAKTFYLLDKVKIFGYGHIGYNYSDKASDTVRNSYGVKRIVTFIEGKLTDNITFQIQTNLGPTPALIEYWMEYAPKTYFKLKVGQMKLPFSLENPMSQSTLENITNSQVINALVGGSTDVLKSGNMGGRDAGVQVGGSFLPVNNHNLIDYQVGVYNGNGVNNLDNNKYKDVVGNIAVNPFSFLKVSTSAYYGKAKYPNTSVNHIRNRWGIGAEVTTKYVYGRSEYIKGKDAAIERDGYYVLLNGHVLPKIDLIGEYDTYNKNIDVDGSRTTNYQIGVQWNYFKRSRIQLHYVYKDNNAGAKAENAVMAQLQIGF